MEATAWPYLCRGGIAELDFLAKLFSSINLNFYSVVMLVAMGSTTNKPINEGNICLQTESLGRTCNLDRIIYVRCSNLLFLWKKTI